MLLGRAGFGDNHKRTERVYIELGLKIKRRKRKKLGVGRSRLSSNPYGIAIDFVFDYLETGRRLRDECLKLHTAKAADFESFVAAIRCSLI